MIKSLAIAIVLAAACGGGDKSVDKPSTPGPATTPAPGPSPVQPQPPAPPPPPSDAAQSADKPPAPPADAAAAEAKTDDFDFDKLKTDDKIKFMKQQVVPPMKEAFQAFDGKKFADFGCKTCHGKDPAKRKYKMPNPDLPKLDLAALKAGKQAPKMAEFMGKTVKPQMAAILHQPEHTEANPKGFGCVECHEMKK